MCGQINFSKKNPSAESLAPGIYCQFKALLDLVYVWTQEITVCARYTQREFAVGNMAVHEQEISAVVVQRPYIILRVDRIIR